MVKRELHEVQADFYKTNIPYSLCLSPRLMKTIHEKYKFSYFTFVH
jgi:hypothetical protein